MSSDEEEEGTPIPGTDWVRKWDDTHECEYYWNSVTGVSQWDAPEVVEEPEERQAVFDAGLLARALSPQPTAGVGGASDAGGAGATSSPGSAGPLTAAQEQKLREVFDHFHSQGSKTITPEDLEALFSRASRVMDADVSAVAATTADPTAAQKKRRKSQQQGDRMHDRIRQWLELADRNHDGQVDEDEFMAIMRDVVVGSGGVQPRASLSVSPAAAAAVSGQVEQGQEAEADPEKQTVAVATHDFYDKQRAKVENGDVNVLVPSGTAIPTPATPGAEASGTAGAVGAILKEDSPGKSTESILAVSSSLSLGSTASPPTTSTSAFMLPSVGEAKSNGGSSTKQLFPPLPVSTSTRRHSLSGTATTTRAESSPQLHRPSSSFLGTGAGTLPSSSTSVSSGLGVGLGLRQKEMQDRLKEQREKTQELHASAMADAGARYDALAQRMTTEAEARAEAAVKLEARLAASERRRTAVEAQLSDAVAAARAEAEMQRDRALAERDEIRLRCENELLAAAEQAKYNERASIATEAEAGDIARARLRADHRAELLRKEAAWEEALRTAVAEAEARGRAALRQSTANGGQELVRANEARAEAAGAAQKAAAALEAANLKLASHEAMAAQDRARQSYAEKLLAQSIGRADATNTAAHEAAMAKMREELEAARADGNARVKEAHDAAEVAAAEAAAQAMAAAEEKDASREAELSVARAEAEEFRASLATAEEEQERLTSRVEELTAVAEQAEVTRGELVDREMELAEAEKLMVRLVEHAAANRAELEREKDKALRDTLDAERIAAADRLKRMRQLEAQRQGSLRNLQVATMEQKLAAQADEHEGSMRQAVEATRHAGAQSELAALAKQKDEFEEAMREKLSSVHQQMGDAMANVATEHGEAMRRALRDAEAAHAEAMEAQRSEAAEAMRAAMAAKSEKHAAQLKSVEEKHLNSQETLLKTASREQAQMSKGVQKAEREAYKVKLASLEAKIRKKEKIAQNAGRMTERTKLTSEYHAKTKRLKEQHEAFMLRRVNQLLNQAARVRHREHVLNALVSCQHGTTLRKLAEKKGRGTTDKWMALNVEHTVVGWCAPGGKAEKQRKFATTVEVEAIASVHFGQLTPIFFRLDHDKTLSAAEPWCCFSFKMKKKGKKIGRTYDFVCPDMDEAVDWVLALSHLIKAKAAGGNSSRPLSMARLRWRRAGMRLRAESEKAGKSPFKFLLQAFQAADVDTNTEFRPRESLRLSEPPLLAHAHATSGHLHETERALSPLGESLSPPPSPLSSERKLLPPVVEKNDEGGDDGEGEGESKSGDEGEAKSGDEDENEGRQMLRQTYMHKHPHSKAPTEEQLDAMQAKLAKKRAERFKAKKGYTPTGDERKKLMSPRTSTAFARENKEEEGEEEERKEEEEKDDGGGGGDWWSNGRTGSTTTSASSSSSSSSAQKQSPKKTKPPPSSAPPKAKLRGRKSAPAGKPPSARKSAPAGKPPTPKKKAAPAGKGKPPAKRKSAPAGKPPASKTLPAPAGKPPSPRKSAALGKPPAGTRRKPHRLSTLPRPPKGKMSPQRKSLAKEEKREDEIPMVGSPAKRLTTNETASAADLMRGMI